MTPLRVFLADDHAIFRDGLRALLQRHGGIEVIGEAGDGHTALAEIERLRPDVVVMDIAMPHLNGLEVTRRVRKALPRTKVLVLSMYEDPDFVRQIVRAGAAGYVLKGSASAELLDALALVRRGKTFVTPRLAQHATASGRPGEAESDRDTLTARERETLQLLAEGLSQAKIAQRLHISPKTVETHRRHIATKLGIRDLAGLVRYAIRKKLVEE
ncbi:MAG TPA: response regulator transcription factor [Terriglobales bacterium]|nr:response regulator transcription factor [Terriglobales bacterium]